MEVITHTLHKLFAISALRKSKISVSTLGKKIEINVIIFLSKKWINDLIFSVKSTHLKYFWQLTWVCIVLKGKLYM